MVKFRKRAKKISKALIGAPEILFDDSSKIVFVSDIHRGDSSGADEFYPCRNIYSAALNYYSQGDFTYVELGDSEELWENRKFSDIQGAYNKIFENLATLYKEGRYLGIAGNHDIVKKRPNWAEENMRIGEGEEAGSLFPNITFPLALVFKHKEKGWKIHALHGHQADCLNSDFWVISRFLVRYLWRPLTLVGIKNPLSAANNSKKKLSIANEFIDWAKRENAMIIVGHTHLTAFPSPGEPLYFNDGCCVHKETMTSIEIVKGAIILVKWGIESNNEGILRVSRNVIKGPIPLADYFA